MDYITIPDDETLSHAETAHLRALAREHDLDDSKADSGLRRDLRRLRDGGLPAECQRCSHRWVYAGASEWYITCPRCRTTVKAPEEPSDN